MFRCSPAHRKQIISSARAGRASKQSATEFVQSERIEASPTGLTTDEREELSRLRREHRQLKCRARSWVRPRPRLHGSRGRSSLALRLGDCESVHSADCHHVSRAGRLRERPCAWRVRVAIRAARALCHDNCQHVRRPAWSSESPGGGLSRG